MAYIPHPGKPAGIQEIELHMHEMMTFKKFNRWDMGRLDRWLDNRPDQIHNATVGLREFFEDINSCPKELGEMDEAFDRLYRCQVSNCWSLMDLNKWLETYPNIIFDATLRLDARLDELFPPTITHIEADYGSLQPYYHQAV
jgi:hypothetical protein